MLEEISLLADNEPTAPQVEEEFSFDSFLRVARFKLRIRSASLLSWSDERLLTLNPPGKSFTDVYRKACIREDYGTL